MHTTTFEEFRERAARGTFVPVVRELMADLLTPVSAFLRIAEHSDEAFLLESVEGGEHMGRYSFLGKDPFLVLRSRGGTTTLERAGHHTVSQRPLLETLRALTSAYRAPHVPGLPRFTGGAVGYLGYEAAAAFEPALEPPLGDGDDDDAGFMIFDTILAFDHVRHRILLIANARVETDSDLESLYQFACAKIDFLERELRRPVSGPPAPRGAPLAVTSGTSQPEFEEMVRSAQEHIAAGDVYQVVLSQRFEARITADPFTVYRALRHVNPSPYMYFLRTGGRAIVGASPEMLVRVEGDRIETHPIAGTRPRGADAEEDQRLAEALKRDEKERAEHVMLVDLGRNDIGRVASWGTVRVRTFMGIERYSHVMHLVSSVEGQLAPERDRLDALAACFPAGTVSGAPKIRAMEIIRELERRRRGIYAGAVGYIDFSGNLDFCIAIRTVVLEDGVASVQAGAGIVIASDPAAEYRETCAKAEAVLEALRLAQEGLAGGDPASAAAPDASQVAA
jgi:anthranilate synthase component I